MSGFQHYDHSLKLTRYWGDIQFSWKQWLRHQSFEALCYAQGLPEDESLAHQAALRVFSHHAVRLLRYTLEVPRYSLVERDLNIPAAAAWVVNAADKLKSLCQGAQGHGTELGPGAVGRSQGEVATEFYKGPDRWCEMRWSF
ncbi:hypothetical protein PG995_006208 [Apiospora arundinis]